MCQGALVPGAISRRLTTVSWTVWFWRVRSAFKSCVSLGPASEGYALGMRTVAGNTSAAPAILKNQRRTNVMTVSSLLRSDAGGGRKNGGGREFGRQIAR